MADEITHNLRLTLANGNLTDLFSPGTIKYTQTTQRKFSVVLNVGTSEESVTFTDISTPGLCYVYNLDQTNFVKYGKGTADYFGRSYPNDIPGCLRLDSSVTTLYLIADTAACNVLVCVYAA